MELHENPDYTGGPQIDPELIWSMSNEQIFVLTKIALREFAIVKKPGGGNDRSRYESLVSEVANFMTLILSEPTRHFIHITPGPPPPWIYFACFANAYARLNEASRGYLHIDMISGAVTTWVVWFWQTGCDPRVWATPLYMSGKLVADDMEGAGEHETSWLDHYAENIWLYKLNYRDTHEKPTGKIEKREQWDPYNTKKHLMATTMSARQCSPYPQCAASYSPGQPAPEPEPGDNPRAPIVNVLFASLIGLAGFGFVAATLKLGGARDQAQRNPVSAAIVSASEASKLPVGSIVFSWVKDKYAPYGRPADALVVIGGGQLTPIAVLPERADGEQPGGDNADLFGSQFVVVSQGRGKLPTHGTAQKAAMKWMNSR